MWKVTENGIIIPIKVTPKASKNEIVGWENGELKVKVTACPEKGNGNSAVIALFSKSLKVAKSRITIISGSTSQHKRLLLSEIEEKTLIEKLPA